MGVGEFDYSFKPKNQQWSTPSHAELSKMKKPNSKSLAMKEVWRKRKEREREAAKTKALYTDG